MQFYFSIYNWTIEAQVCMCLAIMCAVFLLLFYYWRLNLRGGIFCGAKEKDAVDGFPGVSVIVYANDNPISLAEMLQKLLAQKYQGEFEVIVVNDGRSEDVAAVVEAMARTRGNLRYTFIPDEARNLSRKKLAISLGVKSSNYPVVLFTSADCRLSSDVWLSEMTEPFRRGKSVVLGNAVVENLMSASCRFDEAAAATIWLKAAQNGAAYRGIGFNICYLKELFFNVKGFAGGLTYDNGDDDIFISRIVTHDNVATVLTPQSLVVIKSLFPEKTLRDLRLVHCFTGRKLAKGSSRAMGLCAFVLWLMIASVITGIVYSVPNLLHAILFLLILPVVMIPLSFRWVKTGAVLGIQLNAATVMWHALWRWIRTLRYAMVCGRSDRKNFTWGKV